MGLNIGPGLAAWIAAHQATPLGDEDYLTPDYGVSAVPIQIANAQGQKVRTLLGYDKMTNTILEPGPGVVVPAPPAAPTTMYDSTTASDIPANAQVVAGYVDGLYAWSKADWDRFTQAVSKITITVTGGSLADVCDCETGDLTPDQAAAWIQQYPGNIVYCNLSTAPAVVQAMVNAGLGQRNGEGFNQYRLWIADWTGQAHMASVPGADVVATQYADPATGSGGHWDLSLVTPELLANF